MEPIRKAVIPVAGVGTRFLPLTKALPKELLPLVDKPIIQYIVEEATASGIDQIIFVTSENKEAISKHFGHDPDLEGFLEEKNKREELDAIKDISFLADFHFVHQREPLGIGHAVLQAEEAVGGEPFIVFGGDDVIEGDIPAAQQLIEVYEQHGGPVIGVMDIAEDQVDQYGIIDPAEDMGNGVFRLNDIIEKPRRKEAPSHLAVGGRWLLTPDIFEELRKVKPGAGGEIQLTDGIRTLGKKRQLYAKQYDGIYRDCGNKLEYIKAMISFSLQHRTLGPPLKEFIKDLNLS